MWLVPNSITLYYTNSIGNVLGAYKFSGNHWHLVAQCFGSMAAEKRNLKRCIHKEYLVLTDKISLEILKLCKTIFNRYPCPELLLKPPGHPKKCKEEK